VVYTRVIETGARGREEGHPQAWSEAET
jgi:hypothetical protein